MAYVVAPETGRAWAAGFFDGVDSVVIGLKTRTSKEFGTYELKHVHMQIVQVRDGERMLERFKKAVGLTARVRLQEKLDERRRNPIWRLCSQKFEDVQQAMIAMWPYLSETKREAFKKTIAEVTKNYRDRAAMRQAGTRMETA